MKGYCAEGKTMGVLTFRLDNKYLEATVVYSSASITQTIATIKIINALIHIPAVMTNSRPSCAIKCKTCREPKVLLIHSPLQVSSQMAGSKAATKRIRESPDDTSRYCSGKVITPSSCKQSSRDKGCKNKITNNGGGASIIVVKLLRTDTTLDLSQKARVVRNQRCLTTALIPPTHGARTMFTSVCSLQGERFQPEATPPRRK